MIGTILGYVFCVLAGIVVGGTASSALQRREYRAARDTYMVTMQSKLRGQAMQHHEVMRTLTAERDQARNMAQHHLTNLTAYTEYAQTLFDQNNQLRERLSSTPTELEAHNATLQRQFTDQMIERRKTPMVTPTADNYVTGVHHAKDDNGAPVFDTESVEDKKGTPEHQFGTEYIGEPRVLDMYYITDVTYRSMRSVHLSPGVTHAFGDSLLDLPGHYLVVTRVNGHAVHAESVYVSTMPDTPFNEITKYTAYPATDDDITRILLHKDAT